MLWITFIYTWVNFGPSQVSLLRPKSCGESVSEWMLNQHETKKVVNGWITIVSGKAWTKHVRGYLQICRKCKNIKDYSTRYSQVVTHPSTDRARRCLTTVIGREPVYSTWCGRNRWNALNNLHLYLSEFWSIPSQPATSQVMWRKCIWVNVESTWNKKGCEWLDNDCFRQGMDQACKRISSNM